MVTLVNISGRNLIVLLLCLEMLFFTAALVCISVFYLYGIPKFWNYDLLFGAIAVTVVAAAESVVGLALIALIHKGSGSIKIKKFF